MRIARLLSLVLAVLTVGTSAGPDRRRASRRSGCPTTSPTTRTRCRGSERSHVQQAVDQLYNDRRVRLWVVYVDSFSDRTPVSWATNTTRAQRFRRPGRAARGRHHGTGLRASRCRPDISRVRSTHLRRNNIEPALHQEDWAGAAIAAANGLNPTRRSSTGTGVTLVRARSWRWRCSPWRSCCCGCGRGVGAASAAKPIRGGPRVDPADPNALAAVPIDALDDLSKSIVVDVDNAVRTSDNELALAVEEFGATRPHRSASAVTNAKTTLAQAFNVRQILDDAVPETAAATARPADPGGGRRGQSRPRTGCATGSVRTAARSGDQRPVPAGRD